MVLNIINVVNDSDEDERVDLMVFADTNLKNYAILDTTYKNPDEVSNIHRHYYRFPDWDVEEGDFIEVYTGKGVNKSSPEIRKFNAPTIHKFYMGLDDDVNIWNDEADCVELLRVETEDMFIISEDDNA